MYEKCIQELSYISCYVTAILLHCVQEHVSCA